jgi:hypothetical protein
MELIAAIVIAGPLGYFLRSRALTAYLALWAVIFPIQTIVVFNAGDDGNSALYWVFNAVILAAGIGLNTAGTRLRERRATTVTA